jgi:hypothetical protein
MDLAGRVAPAVLVDQVVLEAAAVAAELIA